MADVEAPKRKRSSKKDKKDKKKEDVEKNEDEPEENNADETVPEEKNNEDNEAETVEENKEVEQEENNVAKEGDEDNSPLARIKRIPMRMRLAIAGLLALLFLIILVVVVVILLWTNKGTPPHIVFLLFDDVGYNDVVWNNGNKGKYYQPNLEKMAAEGNILDYNYMQPVCSPSRGTLMTGKYAHNIGMQHAVIRPMDPRCAPSDEKFISEHLQELGYSTHQIGKWHLGFCRVNCTALYRGFDSSYGFFSGYIDSYTKKIRGGYDFRNNGVVEFDTDGEYATDLYTNRAVEIVKSHDSSKPLFLYLSYGATHWPLQAPDKFIALLPQFEGEKQKYYAMMATIDDSVVQIKNALKERNMLDNSIIIMSSDNGAEHDFGSNRPLRGGKMSTYEGGTRVPGFVYSPLMTKTGIRSQGLMHSTDWYPTIIAMAEGVMKHEIDGINQYDMIMNGGNSKRDEMIYQIDKYDEPMFGRGAIRVGDFKLIMGFPGMIDGWEDDENLGDTTTLDLISGGTWTEVDTHVKKHRYDFDRPYMGRYAKHVADMLQLYNIKNDPQERHNLASKMPKRVQEMKNKILKAQETHASINLTLFENDLRGHHDKFDGIWTPGWC